MASKNILIVEDEMYLREMYTMVLQNNGYVMTEAEDGARALELFRDRKFDLILLDIMLPKMNGMEVLQQIRSTNKTIPVFLLTNLGQQEIIDKAEEIGIEKFLIKSQFLPYDLLKILDDFFGKSTTEANPKE